MYRNGYDSYECNLTRYQLRFLLGYRQDTSDALIIKSRYLLLYTSRHSSHGASVAVLIVMKLNFCKRALAPLPLAMHPTLI